MENIFSFGTGTLQFDLTSVNKASTQLLTNSLEIWNRHELIQHIQDPQRCDQIVQFVQELVKQTYPNE